MKKMNAASSSRPPPPGVAATAVPKTLFGQSPTMMTPKTVKPVVVASGNGNTSKDADGVTCVAKAFGMITKGADVLDALVAGVSIVELDPNQTGVGWSGLPNADGVVQLDASCMHGPKKHAGAVAAIEGVRAPAKVALRLAGRATDHHRRRRGATLISARARRQDREGYQREARGLARVGSAAPPARTISIRRSAQA